VLAFLFPDQPYALAVMGCAKEDDARRQRLSAVDQRGAYEPAYGLPFVSGAALAPGETSRLARVEGLPHPSRSWITHEVRSEVVAELIAQRGNVRCLKRDMALKRVGRDNGRWRKTGRR
jgi:hypothetical protein